MAPAPPERGFSPPGKVATLRALARALPRSHQAVGKWLRHPRWPFGQQGPWDVEAVRRWADATLAPNPAAGHAAAPEAAPTGGGLGGTAGLNQRHDIATATQVARLRLIVERESNLRLDRLIKEGRYISREQVERESIRKIVAVRTAFMRLPRALGPLLEQQDRHTCTRVLEQALRDICNAFAGTDEDVAPRAPGTEADSFADQEQPDSPEQPE